MKSVKLKPKMHIRHKLIDEQSKWKTLSSQPKKTCTNKNWVIIRIDGDKMQMWRQKKNGDRLN